MRVNNDAYITSADMSAASITGAPINLESIYCYSIQIVVTGGPPTGTLKLQMSNDLGTDIIGTNITNWTDITGATIAVAAAGSFAFYVDAASYRWVRMVYTRTAGSGTLNARSNTKGV